MKSWKVIPWRFWKIVDRRSDEAREQQLQLAYRHAAYYEKRSREARLMLLGIAVALIIIVALETLRQTKSK